MIERKSGAIVNVSSLAAHNGGGPGALAYSAAKGAVISLTKAIAKELAPHGVRVNCVSPGLIGDTDFHGRFTAKDAFDATARTVPLGRAGTRGGGGGGRRVPGRPRRVVPQRRDGGGQRGPPDAVRPLARRIKGLRWLVIALVFLATVINYIDRQTVSVLKTAISQDLGLTNARLRGHPELLPGASTASARWCRAGCTTRSARGWASRSRSWSGRCAAIAHFFARTVWSFGFWRAVLGFGEAGNWPGAAKAVGEWFPVRERALGMGIFNTGAAVGGALSPPIIAWLASAYGWRTHVRDHGRARLRLARAVAARLPACPSAIPGSPRRSARTSCRTARPRRRTSRRGGRDGASCSATGRSGRSWPAGSSPIPIWWLYVFWLPSYFQEARGFSLQQVGWSAWFPFLAAGVGAMGGRLGVGPPDPAGLVASTARARP